MLCKQCGAPLEDGAMFCANCGAKQEPEQAQPAQPQYQQPVQPQYQQPQAAYQQPQAAYQQPAAQTVSGYEPPYNVPHRGYVGFGEAIKLFFTNYVNFHNRASKSEFWWAILFLAIVSLINFIPIVGSILYVIAFTVPSLSLTVRRLHDIGRGWTSIFFGLIPFAGEIILIVFCLRPSEGDNPWGPGPYGQAAPQAAPYAQTPNYPYQ